MPIHQAIRSGFFKSGHTPTLVAALLYSGMSHMVWVLLGPLAVHIGNDLHLTSTQQYGIVAFPLIVGALLRIPLGMAVDRYGPRRTGLCCQLVVIGALFAAFVAHVETLPGLYLLGAALGIAGTSMAIALPLTSRWYPDEFQGLALGVVGAASGGTVLTAFFAPSLAERFGWHAVLGISLLPLCLAFLLYLALTRDHPNVPPAVTPARYFAALADPDLWWFMLFQAVAYGGIVALTSILVLFFHQGYQLAPVQAGYVTALCVLASAIARPLGGWIADRYGGIRSLQIHYTLVALILGLLAITPSSATTAMCLLIIAMASLGMATSSIFQLLPLRFRNGIGAATGMAGAAAGLGGFLLTHLFGRSAAAAANFSAAFLVFMALSVLCLIGVLYVRKRWRTTWGMAVASSVRI
jgi:NNP family nitrate/nitrite transporter-like MFS transporter